MISNSVTHLQSYNNSAIADISRNSEWYQQDTTAERLYCHTERLCRHTERLCRRDGCLCHRAERLCLRIERRHRRIKWRVFRDVSQCFKCFMMFHNLLRVFHDASQSFTSTSWCFTSGSRCFKTFHDVSQSPLEFFFQEQSYSSLHSGWSLPRDHVRGDIDDPCGAIVDFCGVIADPCSVDVIPEAICGRASPMRRRRSLRDSLNIIKHC